MLEASKMTGDNHEIHDRDRQQLVDSRCSQNMGMRDPPSPMTTKRIRGDGVLAWMMSESIARSRARNCCVARTASVDEMDSNWSCIVVRVGSRTAADPCQKPKPRLRP